MGVIILIYNIFLFACHTILHPNVTLTEFIYTCLQLNVKQDGKEHLFPKNLIMNVCFLYYFMLKCLLLKTNNTQTETEMKH